MDKIDPPTRFGVFNPVGHIVMAYRSLPDLRAAVEGSASEELARRTGSSIRPKK